MEKDILVSIDCLTYNHGKYIAETIEGFLMQKTDFKFEILIHDDASTDNTADIIREYEKKYPGIIKPFYQVENQYSKGVNVEQINNERAKGKYIAICEGDDYWTDPLKLQKQVAYLEANPECSLCVHAALKFSDIRKDIVGEVRPSRRDKIFSAEEAIKGGGGLFATNAMVFRREMAETLPASYAEAGIGDYPLTIHLGDNGYIYYMDDVMSVYRVDVNGSWTERIESNVANAAIQNERTAKLLDTINSHTNFRYNATILRTQKKNRFDILLRQRNLKEVISIEYLRFFLNTDFLLKAMTYGFLSIQKRFAKTLANFN